MYLLIKLYLIESNLLKLSLVSKSLIKLYLIKLHQVSNYVGYVSNFQNRGIHCIVYMCTL